MRPPPLGRSWSLRVATSLLLLMTSSVMATDPSPITVENGCLPADKATGACSDPTIVRCNLEKWEIKDHSLRALLILLLETRKSLAIQDSFCQSPILEWTKQIDCSESTILEGDILKSVAKLKATCYSSAVDLWSFLIDLWSLQCATPNSWS